jgi:hypothetical protein
MLSIDQSQLILSAAGKNPERCAGAQGCSFSSCARSQEEGKSHRRGARGGAEFEAPSVLRVAANKPVLAHRALRLSGRPRGEYSTNAGDGSDVQVHRSFYQRVVQPIGRGDAILISSGGNLLTCDCRAAMHRRNADVGNCALAPGRGIGKLLRIIEMPDCELGAIGRP